MRFGVIDLGTNSIRFDVYEATHKGRETYRIHREKIMVRLGDGLYENGLLQPNAMARALAALESFKLYLDRLEIKKCVTFATCALRDAANAQDFIAMAKSLTGLHIEIISGKKEAKLIAKGILRHTYTPEGIFGLIDIGGGSTEISICEKNRILFSHSFDLGANRLQQVYLKTSPPRSKTAVKELRKHIRDTLKATLKEYELPEIKEAMGSSGTIKAMSKILKKNKEDTEPIKRRSIQTWAETMEPMKIQKLLTIEGMEPKRVDQIVSGAILLDEILKTLSIKKLWFTDFSLREGILAEAIQKFYRKS